MIFEYQVTGEETKEALRPGEWTSLRPGSEERIEQTKRTLAWLAACGAIIAAGSIIKGLMSNFLWLIGVVIVVYLARIYIVSRRDKSKHNDRIFQYEESQRFTVCINNLEMEFLDQTQRIRANWRLVHVSERPTLFAITVLNVSIVLPKRVMSEEQIQEFRELAARPVDKITLNDPEFMESDLNF